MFPFELCNQKREEIREFGLFWTIVRYGPKKWTIVEFRKSRNWHHITRLRAVFCQACVLFMWKADPFLRAICYCFKMWPIFSLPCIVMSRRTKKSMPKMHGPRLLVGILNHYCSAFFVIMTSRNIMRKKRKRCSHKALPKVTDATLVSLQLLAAVGCLCCCLEKLHKKITVLKEPYANRPEVAAIHSDPMMTFLPII